MLKKIFWLILLMGLLIRVTAQPSTPRQLYGDLFVEVQMQSVFPDGKTFVDCTPKYDPAEIMRKYNAEKKRPGFDLKQFVADNFNLPITPADNYKSDISAGVKRHIEDLWSVLGRQPDQPVAKSSLLPLPYPYIVPGGRFREVYYWDSYFTMLGLRESGQTDMIENMVRNFAYLINTYGFIPNGNRSYYLTRSQPPFFAMMVSLLANQKGNYIYAIYQPALLKEYKFWMRGASALKRGGTYKNVVKMPDGTVMNRYWDDSNEPREESYKADVDAARKSREPAPVFYRNSRAAAESGWDFSSRWFRDGKHLGTILTTDIIPVDLNCLMYHLEQAIAVSYETSGNHLQAKVYYGKAAKRREAILKYCWNGQAGFFTDYRFRERQFSKSLTLAGLYPLVFDLATKSQAEKVARIVENRFLKLGGVPATLKITGQQWDAPNGWAPLVYMTVTGLNHYGFNDLAKTIATNWIHLNEKVFNETGKLMEKYNVADTNLVGGGGEYPLQDGFGWTNGVLLKLMDEYGMKK